MTDILFDRPFVNRRGIRPVAAPPIPTIHEVVEQVAKETGVTVAEIMGPQKCRRVAAARQYAYWRAAKETGKSLPLIARTIGDRDHTTILFGIRQHEKRMGEQSGA